MSDFVPYDIIIFYVIYLNKIHKVDRKNKANKLRQ